MKLEMDGSAKARMHQNGVVLQNSGGALGRIIGIQRKVFRGIPISRLKVSLVVDLDIPTDFFRAPRGSVFSEVCILLGLGTAILT
jgi:hypothetical protein